MTVERDSMRKRFEDVVQHSVRGVPITSTSTARDGQNDGDAAPLLATITALQEQTHAMSNELEQVKGNADWLQEDHARLEAGSNQWWEEHEERQAGTAQAISTTVAAPWGH